LLPLFSSVSSSPKVETVYRTRPASQTDSGRGRPLKAISSHVDWLCPDSAISLQSEVVQCFAFRLLSFVRSTYCWGHLSTTPPYYSSWKPHTKPALLCGVSRERDRRRGRTDLRGVFGWIV